VLAVDFWVKILFVVDLRNVSILFYRIRREKRFFSYIIKEIFCSFFLIACQLLKRQTIMGMEYKKSFFWNNIIFFCFDCYNFLKRKRKRNWQSRWDERKKSGAILLKLFLYKTTWKLVLSSLMVFLPHIKS